MQPFPEAGLSEDLGELCRADGALRLSVFLPTHRAGADVRQGPLRLRRAMRAAEAEFAALDVPKREFWPVLQALESLVENEDFWQHQGDGLALYGAGRMLRHYRLPRALPERVVVAERFQLKPLLAFDQSNVPFALLALGTKQVRYFEGDAHKLEEQRPEGMPASLVDALGPEHREKSLQHHSSGKEAPTVYHGQGAAKNDDSEDVLRFLRLVDQAIVGHQQKPRPLLIAGVEENLAQYRRITKHPQLVDAALAWTPSRDRIDDLHERAVAALATAREGETELLERLQAAIAKERGSHELGEALVAATAGRIGELAVAADAELWGRIERNELGEPRPLVRGEEERGHGELDLLDALACIGRANGATVAVLPSERLPGGQRLAASYRW